ncbi:unnamed protein product [Orchesella dallaii]|uniref:Ubiquinone biosynthesis monooxygenase COQ6, mitochondrial n=1 Tax=Orchesella dallaii TaxID=48710 RepID=A0ABP1RC77_9HEXA
MSFRKYPFLIGRLTRNIKTFKNGILTTGLTPLENISTPSVCVSCRTLSSSSSSSSESESENDLSAEFYDIVIVGGGLVGTALAAALGSNGRLANKQILLLDSAKNFGTKPPESERDGGDPNFSNRVVALSPGSKALLNRLGVWENVWRSQTVSCLQVWDALSDANITFNYPDYTTPVSHIVENPVLAHAICQTLDLVDKVKVEFGSKVKSCTIPSSENPREKASVVLENDRILKTDLLIGADGFNSKVRSSISSPSIAFNYDRNAVVATLKLCDTPENYIAWQRFLPSGGPIALLPLAPNYSSLVWSTTPNHAKELLDMEPYDFVEAVNSAFWKEYERSELVKKSCELLNALKLNNKGPRVLPPSIIEVVDKSRASFPLGFGHSAYYASRRAVLIGDAAHRVHPLAGQGLNLGLGDIEVLVQVLSETVGIGGDIGAFDTLREYESQRQRHNIAIQSGIDALHRLYSIDFPPIVALRSIGLSVVNSSELMKKFFMSHAAA